MQACCEKPERSFTNRGVGVPPTYQEYGERSSKPSVVCIPGAFQAQRCFQHLYRALVMQGYHVIGIDLPGQGQASLIPEGVLPTPDLWSRYIQEVLDDAHLGNQRLIFCAWSLGASVLRNYLLSSGQDRVAGLILVAPVVGTMHCFEHLHDQGNADALAAFQTVGKIFDLHAPVFTRQEAFERFFQRLTAQPLAPDESYETYGYNIQAFQRLNALGGDYLMQDAEGDTAELLRSIHVPTLLIHGRQDALIPWSYSQLLAETLPTATLRLYENCGHTPMLEQPAQMNQDVLLFLEKLS